MIIISSGFHEANEVHGNWGFLPGQRGVIFGKLANGTATKASAWYQPINNTWQVYEPAFPDLRQSAFVVEQEEYGIFWVVGGTNSAGSQIQKTYELNFNTFKERYNLDSMPSQSIAHSEP